MSTLVRAPRSVLFIVNPHSRRGGDFDLDALVERLAMAGLRVDLCRLREGEDLTDVLRDRSARFDAIVLGGGDGTLGAAAGILAGRPVPVGIVPLGTANDFARGLGIPLDPPAAIDVVVRGRVRAVDLGVANGRPFLNAAGIGLGPAMTEEMSAQEKARWGVLAYPRALLRAFMHRRSFTATVRFDSTTERLRALQLTVANGRYYGGGMTAEARVRVDDGKLNLVVIRPARVLTLIGLLPKLRRGAVGDEPALRAYCADRFRIETRRPMPVTTDGEFTTETPVELTVRRRAVRVFVPEPD